jgi:hypothetical protein
MTGSLTGLPLLHNVFDLPLDRVLQTSFRIIGKTRSPARVSRTIRSGGGQRIRLSSNAQSAGPKAGVKRNVAAGCSFDWNCAH